MTYLEKLLFRVVKPGNPLVSAGNTTLSYVKPVEEWTLEDREKWNNLVVKEPIVGLERRVLSTTLPEKEAQHNEVFETAHKEITKIKFDS